MFDRFTDRARKVMGLARQEAQRFNHQYIGTEHLLLGMVQEGSGIAANTLRNLDVSPQQIEAEIKKLTQDGPTMVTMGQLPFTPRTTKVLEYASAAAHDMRHNYIGTEHLLLGVITETGGVAAQALGNLGLNLQNIRKEVMELLGEDLPKPETPAEPVQDALLELAPTFFDRYQEFTNTTAIYPGAGTGNYVAMTYVALKSAGECGEFNEKLGKWMRKQGSIEAISRENMTEELRLELAKELGDVVWYMARAADELGFRLSEVMQLNVEKLSSRKRRGKLDGKGDNR